MILFSRPFFWSRVSLRWRAAPQYLNKVSSDSTAKHEFLSSVARLGLFLPYVTTNCAVNHFMDNTQNCIHHFRRHLWLRLQSNQETLNYQSLLSGFSDLKTPQHFHPSPRKGRYKRRKLVTEPKRKTVESLIFVIHKVNISQSSRCLWWTSNSHVAIQEVLSEQSLRYC